MAKRTSRYAAMSASDLARETRERGLQKPDVINISEWADWLESLDQQEAETVVAESAVVEAKAAPAKPSKPKSSK